jgi:hypothetical protein
MFKTRTLFLSLVYVCLQRNISGAGSTPEHIRISSVRSVRCTLMWSAVRLVKNTHTHTQHTQTHTHTCTYTHKHTCTHTHTHTDTHTHIHTYRHTHTHYIYAGKILVLPPEKRRLQRGIRLAHGFNRVRLGFDGGDPFDRLHGFQKGRFRRKLTRAELGLGLGLGPNPNPNPKP